MSDETRGVQPPKKDEPGRVIIVVVGVGLVLIGLTLLGRQFWWPWLPFARVWSIIRGAGWGLGLVIIGIISIMWSRTRGFTPPAKGARLYRSRADRVLGGVLGGIAEYLGADPTLVRLAFVGLSLMFGVWPALVAYVVAVIIVPEAPVGEVARPAPQVPPLASPPPIPPPAPPPPPTAPPAAPAPPDSPAKPE